jgi:dCTP deaminase
MSIRPDNWIRRMALSHNMISPFVEQQVRSIGDSTDKVISYGVSSYGYDLRVANEFKIFTNIYNSIVDPKNFKDDAFIPYQGDICIVPPNSFALARSIEYFKIPRNVLTICLGKSTYARCGIIVNVTPFEPEWEGFLTQLLFPQRFMLTKVSRRYSFLNLISNAKLLTPIAVANI